MRSATTHRSVTERIGPALAAELWSVLTADPIRELITTSEPVEVWVDRPAGRVRLLVRVLSAVLRRARSTSTDDRCGTAPSPTPLAQLDRAAAMGFDIVYLPPIHPIGEVNRKGRNNSVDCEPGDVGSPWAIGSAAGGHDAVHPELGTIADFDAFVARPRERAASRWPWIWRCSCSPDHPWVDAAPGVVHHPARTASIAYAENPPKKYQDIYPLNFDNDPDGLYAEVLRVVRFWIDHGVTIFRVDNPHTKPINFWEWLIAAGARDGAGRDLSRRGVHRSGR